MWVRIEGRDAGVVKARNPAFRPVHLVTVDAAADPAAVAPHRLLWETCDLCNLRNDAVHRSWVPRTAHQISEVISPGVLLDIFQGFTCDLLAVALHFRSGQGWEQADVGERRIVVTPASEIEDRRDEDQCVERDAVLALQPVGDFRPAKAAI